MGCVCGKPLAAKDSHESVRERQLNSGSLDLKVSEVVSSRKEGSIQMKDWAEDGRSRWGAMDKKGNDSRRVRDDHNEEISAVNHPKRGSVPKAMEGEQVAAGWPSWLVVVAGEAINGWIPRSANTFQKLDKIGQGTYSSVYKACDLTNKKIVALKRVRFDIMDSESVKFMAREILILRRLDHPNIIKLEGLVTSRASCSLYLVFEYMEHDLMGLGSLPGIKFTEPQVKCYMHQLLSGLDHCHTSGVLHRDIKGSNLLIDNHGALKIADFGLASFFDHHKGEPLTSRVVTLWYRPPELLLGATHYGTEVDLWSAGCILGELYAGKPIMPGRTEVEQLHKIFKLCGSPSEQYWKRSKLPHSTVFKPVQPYRRQLAETFKNFPAAAMRLMETLLSIDPMERGTAAFALKSQFFTTDPLACDPSSLPKYPPSKEIDAKLREATARRQNALARGQRAGCDVRGSKEPQEVPVTHTNSEFSMSMLRKQDYVNPRSQNELFNPHRDDTVSPSDPPGKVQSVKETCESFAIHPSKKGAYSGPLVSGVGWKDGGSTHADTSICSTGAGLASLSDLNESSTVPLEQCSDKPDSLPFDASNELYTYSRSTWKVDKTLQTQNKASSLRSKTSLFSTNTQVQYGNGLKNEKMHISGPLVSSNNVDQMLKDHELHIQENSRRVRGEKTRPPGGVQVAGNQSRKNPFSSCSHAVG